MAQKRVSLVSAPGKIIFSGEHSVVYGQPALLAAINRRLFLGVEKAAKTKIITHEPGKLAQLAFEKTIKVLKESPEGIEITINSQIPVARGLGSSAALAVAMVGGLFKYFKKPRPKSLINQIAFEIEKKQHGNPSGGDNSIVCFGGVLRFQKRAGKFIMEPLRTKLDLSRFVLLDSGRAEETTGEMVGQVNKKLSREKKMAQKITLMGKLTKAMIASFENADFTCLPELIRENQRLLEEIGVVGKKAQKIIKKIENLGGAAKICGAGGLKTGSGVILGYHQEPSLVLALAKKEKLVHFPVKLGGKGLKDEKS